MDGCLLCLEINIELADSIKVDSKQWQEHNIKILLEKHFWLMDTVKSYAWLCSTCWQELYDFHKFYSRVEEAHVEFGKLIKREENVCQLQEHKDTYNHETGSRHQETYKNETFESEKFTECYIETEKLIDQPKTQDMMPLEEEQDLIKDEPTDNLETSEITLPQPCKRKRSCTNLLIDIELSTEDPLEKCKTSKKYVVLKKKNIPKSNKKLKSVVKLSQLKQNHDLIDVNTAPDLPLTTRDPLEKCKTSKKSVELKSKNIPKSNKNLKSLAKLPQIKPNNNLIDSNTSSDLPLECDPNNDIEFDTDSNYDPDSDSNYDPDSDLPETTEKSKSKRKRTYYNHREHRKENDKFLAEHFKQMHCDICETPMEDFAFMQKHFAEKHNQMGYVICCSKKFIGRSLLADHIRCHLNPDHFKCNPCDKTFSDHIRLERHIRLVHREGDLVKPHCCDVCGKSFAEASKLESHKRLHLPEEKKFPCTECGKSYASDHRLNAHINIIHLKKFHKICHICGKSVSTTKRYKTHMDKHEGKPPPQISCDICGLRLVGEMGLKRHKKSQHPEGGKKDHHCPMCPRVSPTLSALKMHINTVHGKGREYKCTICEKIYRRPDSLNEHMASHAGTALYTCSLCPKTFVTNGGIHAHRKKKHRKEWEEEQLHKYSGILPQQHKHPVITKDNND